MADFLAHPLILLLFGALFSGLLIPALTRRWHAGQKALEIKTGLVGELSETIMEMIMSIQFVHLRSVEGLGQQEFDQAYQAWEVRSAVIGAKLRAYFPGTTIPDEWSTFSEIVTVFYAMEGVNEDKKPEMASTIGKKLSEMPAGSQHQEGEDWGSLKERILEEKARLIQRVLGSKISVLKAG